MTKPAQRRDHTPRRRTRLYRLLTRRRFIRVLAFTLCAAVFACASCVSEAVAQTVHRPAANYKCHDARLAFRKAEAAATASDNTRALQLYQQAIEAYELCDNPTHDDEALEATAMIGAGAYLYDNGDQNAARDLYISAATKLWALCTEANSLSVETWTRAEADTLTYRALAERMMGLDPIQACDEIYPRPTPRPQ